ncbi:hypothetical protein AMTRI_Chr09g32630 [Amborella trichopoda]
MWVVDPNVEIPIASSSISDSIVIPPGPSSLWEREQGGPLEDQIMEIVLPTQMETNCCLRYWCLPFENGIWCLSFPSPHYQGHFFPALP